MGERNGRRINEADFQLERKSAQSRADPVDDKPVSDAASHRKKQMVQKGVRDGNVLDEAIVKVFTGENIRYTECEIVLRIIKGIKLF